MMCPSSRAVRGDSERPCMGMQAATILMPAGLVALFWPLTSASLFLILYGLTAVYFSGVMVSHCNPSRPSPASVPHTHAIHVPALAACSIRGASRLHLARPTVRWVQGGVGQRV